MLLVWSVRRLIAQAFGGFRLDKQTVAADPSERVFQWLQKTFKEQGILGGDGTE
jgi:hypothetical protein